MNLINLIPAAVALYSVYKSRSDLQEQFDNLKDSTQAQVDVVREDVDKVINPATTIIDKIFIKPTAYFRSIADKYWTMAFFVQIQNNSDYQINLRGIRLTVNIAGITSTFMPYYLGNVWLQPGQATQLQLSGVYSKIFYEQKTDREIVRKYLNDSSIKHEIVCDAEILLVSGAQYKGVQDNLKGYIMKQQQLVDGSYASGSKNGSGANIEEFNKTYGS